MSTFEGSAVKVRCVDCIRLQDNRCVAKNSKVAAKKRRTCSSYYFKGFYENRTPADAMYVPYVSKETRKMVSRLAKLGITPVSEKDNNLIVVPKTTATSSPRSPDTEKPLIWTPDSTNE